LICSSRLLATLLKMAKVGKMMLVANSQIALEL